MDKARQIGSCRCHRDKRCSSSSSSFLRFEHQITAALSPPIDQSSKALSLVIWTVFLIDFIDKTQSKYINEQNIMSGGLV